MVNISTAQAMANPLLNRTMADFITTFFAEKDLDLEIYRVESDNGTLNLISSSDVITRIGFTRGEERLKIEHILREIDLANGDVHNFLRYLARAMTISL